MDKLKTLEDIFPKFLRIPDYQRGYAWRNDKQNNQLDDFWNDLEDLQDGQKHYTGVLTLEKVTPEMKKDWQNNDREAYNAENVFYIIDGQQRLTTSIILIKVLLDSLERDKVEWLTEDDSLDTMKTHYIGKKNQHGTNYYFFGYTFDNPSFEFLKAEIFGDKTLATSSYEGKQTLYTQNLLRAKEFFEEKVSKLENIEQKKEIFKKLTKQFKFNVYEVDKETDVFMAFETMNNRGKPLSKLELLKNRLIYLSVKLENPDLRVAINECWKSIYEYLGKDKDSLLDEDDFLRDHWIMYYGYKDDKDAPTFDKYLLNKRFSIKRITHKNEQFELITPDEIEKYILSLKECVKHWYYLHNIKQSVYSDEIQFLLDKFKRLRYGVFKPLIMATFVKKENEQDICNLLKVIEQFIFVMFMILSKRSDTGNSSLYDLTHEYFLNQKDIYQASQDISDLLYDKYFIMSDFEKTFDSLFDKGNGYYDWDGLRYFLYEYELCLKEKTKNNDFKVVWDNFNNKKKEESIEHILPQTPKDKSWREALKSLNSKDKKKLTHALGNLVLLANNKNSTLQNNSFEIKKNGIEGNFVGFKNGSYAEQEINEEKTWGIQEIQNRTKKLIEFLFGERWGIGLLVERLIRDEYEERNIEEIKEKLCFKVK